MSVPTIARVDPLERHGALKRAYLRFMRSRFGRWFGIKVATRVDPWLLRVTGGRLTTPLVVPVALMTTRGARSGRERVNPVLYFSDGDDVVVVASSFGRDRHPAWFHNMMAHPEVTLRVGAAQARYRGRVVAGGERERLWSLACRVYPGYEDYRRRAREREIPVLRLTPVS